MRPFKITFNSEPWDITVRPLHANNGETYEGAGRMVLDSYVRADLFLYVALHEGLHACFPWLTEAAIEEAAQSLGDLMKKLGFKCPPRPEDKK